MKKRTTMMMVLLVGLLAAAMPLAAQEDSQYTSKALDRIEEFLQQHELVPHILKVETISVDTAEKIAQQQLKSYYLVLDPTPANPPRVFVTSLGAQVGSGRGDAIAFIEESVTADKATNSLIINATEASIARIARTLEMTGQSMAERRESAQQTERLLLVLLESPAEGGAVALRPWQQPTEQLALEQVNKELGKFPPHILKAIEDSQAAGRGVENVPWPKEQVYEAMALMKQKQESEKKIAERGPQPADMLPGFGMMPGMDAGMMPGMDPAMMGMGFAPGFAAPAPTPSNRRSYTGEQLIEQFKLSPADLELFNIESATEIGRAVTSLSAEAQSTSVRLEASGKKYEISILMGDRRDDQVALRVRLAATPGSERFDSTIRARAGRGTFVGVTDSNRALILVLLRLPEEAEAATN